MSEEERSPAYIHNVNVLDVCIAAKMPIQMVEDQAILDADIAAKMTTQTAEDQAIVFFYDEFRDVIVWITPYHQEHCDIGALVEAHPEVIYFYATIREI